MSTVFYPGCKVVAQYPQESKRLWEYLESKGIEKTGCCRKNYDKPGADDTAVYICNNCHEILSANSEAGNLIPVWQIIADDPDFPYPDYGGKEVVLQDCWLATGNHEVHDLVRQLLAAMNLNIIELPATRDETRWCGTNIFGEASESNLELAPHRWVDLKNEQCQAVPKEDWEATLRERYASLPTQEVACYCKFCADGLKLGGKTPLHLLQLLFPAE